MTNKVLLLAMTGIALLSKVIPKRKGLSLYGSMSGYSVADNPKYAYINDSSSKEKFFILKNKERLLYQFPDGSSPVYAYSLKGLALQLIAEKVYFSHGIFDFVSPLIWGSEKHNLWHGVPIKEIGPAADWGKDSILKIKFKSLFYQAFGHMYYMSCDYVYCPFKDRIPDYRRFFSIPNPSILIKEQARNFASSTIRKANTTATTILYAPTYRKYSSTPDAISKYLKEIGLYSEELSTQLKVNRSSLIIRPHPIDREAYSKIELPSFCFLDTSNDLYEVLHSYKAVITDYSSIYYDCLEADINCYLIAPDIDIYLSEVSIKEDFIEQIRRKDEESLTAALKKAFN